MNADKVRFCLINVVAAGQEEEAAASVEYLKRETELHGYLQLKKSEQTSQAGRVMHTVTSQPYFYEGLRRRSSFLAIRRQLSEFCAAHAIGAIYASSLSVSQYCMGNGVPLVADVHDAISLLAWRSSRAGGGLGKRIRELAEAASIRRYERKLSRASSFYVVNSPVDFSYLARFADRRKLTVIENGVDAGFFFHRLPEASRDALVFTGDFGYAPNEQAALLLADRLFPALRKRYGGLRLTLVGRNPPPRLLALRGQPGVQVTGFVPDIRQYIWRAGIYVSPLRFGTGMKNKILEAMALGTPIVASPTSCEGIEVEDGRHLLVARTDEEFEAAVVRLREEQGLAERLSREARQLVEKRYCWEAKASQMQHLLETAAGERRASAGNQ